MTDRKKMLRCYLLVIHNNMYIWTGPDEISKPFVR